MVSIFYLGIKGWMMKIFFVVLFDLILYGILLQNIDGFESLLFYQKQPLFLFRTISFYLSLLIDLLILFIGVFTIFYLLLTNNQMSITKVWGIFFLIITFFSFTTTILTLNKGKKEIDIFIEMDDLDIFNLEKENLCCLDLINPNCGCFELEGKLIKSCQYIKREEVCSIKTAHCRRCIDHSQNVFFISSIHNCIQSIIILFTSLYILKEWYIDSKLITSPNTKED